MMRPNKYTWLTIIGLIIIILLQFLPLHLPIREKSASFSISKEKIAEIYTHPCIVLTALIYIGLLIVGLVNIFTLAIGKIKKRPFEIIATPIKKFPLSSLEASKLFFIIIFVILALNLIEIALFAYCKNLDTLSISIFANLIFELGVAAIILKFISVNFFGFKINKLSLSALFKIYTAILPLILSSLLLSSYLLEKFGIQPQPNPIIELILILKNKTLLIILSLQIILLGPLAEELFFRGFIYKLLRGKFSFIFSSLAVSFTFALLHKEPLNIGALFIISLALCYLYEKTQNILTPIIFHSLYNTLNLSFLFLVKSLI